MPSNENQSDKSDSGASAKNVLADEQKKRIYLLSSVAVIQGISLALLLGDAIFDITGLEYTLGLDTPLADVIEFLSVLALSLGFLVAIFAIRNLLNRVASTQRQLSVAQGAFHTLLQDHFDEWGLTPAQREVALFSIKGLTNGEIAELRKTSEGTVKAQLNGVYTKAGVSSKPQLMGLFIEELMATPLTEKK